MGPLFEEHLALGATLDHGVARSYPGVGAADLTEVVLADVSDICVLRLAGPVAPAFAEAAFAGKALGVGEAAFEAVLTGDGSVASVPVLARTGEAEYVALDLSERAEVLEGWLSFLASVEQGGHAPFAGLVQEDATGTHAALLIAGDGADRVLKDYLRGQKLPPRGSVLQLTLDAIPAILITLPTRTPCRLIMVAPAHARVLWRSLLSFGEVTPLGRDELERVAEARLGWPAALATEGPVRLSRVVLEHAGLIREDATFVGARGLDA